jgi:hypothetical protein
MSGQTDEDRIFQQLVVTFDTPAFLRRARNVEDAWEQLLDRCRRQREEWLKFPKLRLATVFALAGTDDKLREYLNCEDADSLVALRNEWQPRLRITLPPAHTPQQLRAALQQLATSFERFNRRWDEFVRALDLEDINRLREGYNRFYVLEKECALRSAKVARAGFVPLPPATIQDVFMQYQLLPVVR